jgi:LysM repeat protein
MFWVVSAIRPNPDIFKRSIDELMKTNLFKGLSLTAIITFLSISFAFGQISTQSTGARNIQPDNSGEERVNQITADAGRKFNEGLLSLQDNRRSIARGKFDEALEVFLMSNVNIKGNAKLNNCYNQLIETIYLMEFPNNKQQPQVKVLAVTCGWNIDNQLAENVVKLSQSQEKVASTTGSPETNLTAANGNQTDYNKVGFSEMQFNYQNDELAQLPPELTPDEIASTETQEGKLIYDRITYAVNSGSLGFKFQMHPLIQQYIGYYQGRGRVTMETGLYRSGMFMRMARQIFRSEGVPEYVAWLGQVESAWKPTVKSWAAASGLWQFIPGTGSRYGLRQNGYVDERNSFEKATRASAQYLKFLANRYGGNWELAMAAYNSGEGNVDRAIRKAGVANFWVAYPYLPRETKNYVPNILAVILIANNPNGYGFGHVRPAPQLQYELLRVPPSTSLTTVAQLSDTNLEYIRYLNPEFRSNITPPEPYIIRVPAGRGNAVAGILKKLPSAGRTNVAVTTMMKGETAQNIANQKGVAANQVTVVGNKAIVNQGNGVKETSYNRPTSSPIVPPKNKIQFYTVKSGDTVSSVASKLGYTPAEFANLNGVNLNERLAAGRQLKYQAK